VADEDLKRLLDTIRQENANAHTETRRHFDVAVERIDDRFDRLAETVAQVDEKVERKAADLQERMERGFAETQAISNSPMQNSTAEFARWKRPSGRSKIPSPT